MDGAAFIFHFVRCVCVCLLTLAECVLSRMTNGTGVWANERAARVNKERNEHIAKRETYKNRRETERERRTVVQMKNNSTDAIYVPLSNDVLVRRFKIESEHRMGWDERWRETRKRRQRATSWIYFVFSCLQCIELSFVCVCCALLSHTSFIRSIPFLINDVRSEHKRMCQSLCVFSCDIYSNRWRTCMKTWRCASVFVCAMHSTIVPEEKCRRYCCCRIESHEGYFIRADFSTSFSIVVSSFVNFARHEYPSTQPPPPSTPPSLPQP